MQDFGRILIVIGIITSVVGVIFYFSSKIPFVGRLPGDILVKKENFTFYFPLATSILVSIILSLILYFFNRR
jgi:hypothetical protein